MQVDQSDFLKFISAQTEFNHRLLHLAALTALKIDPKSEDRPLFDALQSAIDSNEKLLDFFKSAVEKTKQSIKS